MAGEGFLKEVNGQVTETLATQTGGAGNENKIPSLDANGLLPADMLPVGVGADTTTLTASEALTSGDFVNVWDDTGVTKVRKAIAEDAKLADGFVLDNFALNDPALVYFEGRNTAANLEGGGSFVGGTRYFLSDATAGTVTATSPTASGKHVQRIGKAYSTTAISTEGMSIATIKKA